MYQRRVQLIAVVYILLVACLMGRLFQLQIIYGEHHRQRTEDNILDIRQVRSWRGSIVDVHGTVLAHDNLSWDLSVTLDEFDDAKSALRDLRRIVGLPRRVMRKPPNHFVIAPYLQGLTAEQSTELQLWVKRYLFMDNQSALVWLSDPDLQLRTMIEDIIRQQQDAVLLHMSSQLHISLDALRDSIDHKREALQAQIAKGWETSRVYHRPQPFLRNISQEHAQAIELHHELFPGISITSSLRREYPEGEAISHLIGYVNRINADEYQAMRNVREEFEGHRLDSIAPDAIIGRTGLERAYEDQLRGQDGVQLVERDAHGNVRTVLASRDPVSGGVVQLTLNIDLQRKVFDSFKRRNFRGALAAVDVHTGEVLALVSYPSFDNNWFIQPTDNASLRTLFADTTANRLRAPAVNRASTAIYPPGSAIKIFMAMAGLQTGTITPAHMESCTWGATSPYGHKLCEGVHYDVNVQVAIQRSCNIFFYNLGLRMGVDRMHEILQTYGLGQRTGLEACDSSGLVGSREWKLKRYDQPWYPAETEDMSIGQGFMMVSPLQVARFYAAVANGGTLYPNSIVRSINTKKQHRAAATSLHFDATSLQLVRHGMYLVTHQQGGTAFRTNLKNYGVVGKTGTAQVQGKKPHAWFAGYAPYDNPEVAFAVLVENSGHGAEFAGPIAEEFMRAYYNTKENK